MHLKSITYLYRFVIKSMAHHCLDKECKYYQLFLLLRTKRNFQRSITITTITLTRTIKIKIRITKTIKMMNPLIHGTIGTNGRKKKRKPLNTIGITGSHSMENHMQRIHNCTFSNIHGEA